MRTRLVVGLAAATISVTAIACSSASNPYATVDEYCTAYAKAICQVSTTCQFDAGTCQTYQKQQCTATSQTATATRAYNSGNVQACINALNAAYGNSPTSVSQSTIQNYTQVCAKVFPGTVTQGNACQSNLDCVNAADVCAAAPGVQAVCATPTPKQVNDICADPGDECPVNSYCAAQNGGSPRCVSSQTTNQPCSASQPCDSNDQCVSGVCQPLSSQGEACSASTNCGTTPSGQQMFCDLYTDPQAPTPVCVTSLTFARGSVDCLGIEGQGTTGTGSSSGSTSSSGSSSGSTGSSSGTTSSSGGGGDGGSEGGSSGGGDAASD